MLQEILSWYAYAESGAVTGRSTDWIEPQTDAQLDRFDVLDDPDHVTDLLNDTRRLDTELRPEDWRHLWSRYGLEALIDLARRGDWPASADDAEVADALLNESLVAGYDPVSGELGAFDRKTKIFTPADDRGRNS